MSRAREQTSQELRPFLEATAKTIKEMENQPSMQLDRAVLTELKRIALDFITATDEDLLRGKCKLFISEVQRAEATVGVKLPLGSIAKNNVVKLLFVLASYSRVLEYLKNVSQYMVR